MDHNGFINAAVAAYVRAYITVAVRPIDRRTAEAEFLGFCKAADALGIVMTPTHFRMVCLDAERLLGERPSWQAVNNTALREWDALLANEVGARCGLTIVVQD